MKVLKIQRKQNVGTVAALYSELKKAAPRCAIQIPSDLDEYRICGKGEFLQFLLTWAKHCPDAPIVTHISPQASQLDKSNQLRKLFGEEHGFLLGLISRRYGLMPQRRFLDANLGELPPILVEEAFKKCRIFEFNEPMTKGTRAFLALDDLIDREGGVLEPFTNVYQKRNPSYSPLKEAFMKLLLELFRRTPSRFSFPRIQGKKHFNEFLEHVTQFTYELTVYVRFII